MKLSVVIPAYNEEKNIIPCLQELRKTVWDENYIPYEIVVVNDNSTDETEQVIRAEMAIDPNIRLVNRTSPGGFGRAVRAGIEAVRGDVVVICMADLSDDPQDVIAYYRKICEGYDCVYGSRFIKGSHVENYPWFKLCVNRVVNTAIRFLFRAPFNDLTNAFKAYRTSVLRECGPFKACHFNITLELSLSALIRNYKITQIPINWYGRTWGSSNLRLTEMGRRYLCTVLMFFCQRVLIKDDIVEDQLANERDSGSEMDTLKERIGRLEEVLATVDQELDQPEPVST